MSDVIWSNQDYQGTSRIEHLPDAVAADEPATKGQLDAGLAATVEGLKSKNPARVRVVSNVNIAAPGAVLDTVTMALNDRVLLDGQTTAAEKGLYTYNGAASPMTRTADANTAAEVTGMVVMILEGPSGAPGGVSRTYRQTATGITLGTTPLAFAEFGPQLNDASTTQKGISEFADGAETLAGTDGTRAVTPLGLASLVKRYLVNIGDGTSNLFTLTHSLNSEDVDVTVRETGGSKRFVSVEKKTNGVNQVIIGPTSAAPALNELRVSVALRV